MTERNAPHFVHCHVYVGHPCSCGGNYRGDQPGLVLTEDQVIAVARGWFYVRDEER